MIVRYDHYNAARQILMQAGSIAADKPHNHHPFGKGVPDYWCVQLLREVVDEFAHKGSITPEQRQAVYDAAREMGLHWQHLQNELVVHW